MKRLVALVLSLCALMGVAGAQPRSYIGMDRNDYPGYAALLKLSRTFAFTGYWLNNPPGAKSNSWKGHRRDVMRTGMGFLVLWNGRAYKDLGNRAAVLGKADGQAAVAAARKDGFPNRTVIFLDQEEGGRLLPEQREYLHSWIDAVTAGGFRAGVYCSGIEAKEASGEAVVTAEDIRKNADGREIVYWVANDSCPPAPGCKAKSTVRPQDSGVEFASVWQYAQSPMRAEQTDACKKTYDVTTNCYAPGTKIDVDIDVATTRDPSGGR